MRARLGIGVVFVVALSACGGASTPPASTPPPSAATAPGSLPPSLPTATNAQLSVAPASPTAPTPEATAPSVAPSAAVDLSTLDACTLLDEADVRKLTGTSLEFATSQPDKRQCFWGATTPVPPYVEIRVFPRPGGLSGYTFNPGSGCSIVDVSGVGSEAKGATCTDPQRKVFLLAWDRGVALQLLVNEPQGPLEPDDLADAVNASLERI